MTEKIDTSREAVQKTGKAFLIAGSVFAGVLFLSHSHISGWSNWNWTQGFAAQGWRWFLGIGAGLFGLSHVAYPIMKPIHFAWMKLAFVLGWISTRVVLGVFFYLVLTPIGLLMRPFGKDLLKRNLDRSAKTYWVKRAQTPFDPQAYERLF